MCADECLFLVKKRSCSGYHLKTGLDPEPTYPETTSEGTVWVGLRT